MAAASWVSTGGSSGSPGTFPANSASPSLPAPTSSWARVCRVQNKLLFQEEIPFLAPRNTFGVLDGRFLRDFSVLLGLSLTPALPQAEEGAQDAAPA